jgi:hypothetical protein
MSGAGLQSTYSRAAAARLFEPNSDQMAKHLPELGEALMAACIDLKRCPQPDRCEALMARLDGARAHILQLRAALMREATAPEPPYAA